MNYICNLPPSTYLHAKFYDIIPIFITKYINKSNESNNASNRSEKDSDPWSKVRKNQYGSQTFQEWNKF